MLAVLPKCGGAVMTGLPLTQLTQQLTQPSTATRQPRLSHPLLPALQLVLPSQAPPAALLLQF